jgi:hypothetical protein
MMKIINKSGQEEMIGFVMIVIRVAVILLVFIGFSLRTSQTQDIESYEVESFIQASLQHTTECRDNFGYLSVDKLIFECMNGGECSDGENACEVLSNSLGEITREAWRIENRPVEGYRLEVLLEGEPLIPEMFEGNETNNHKGAIQDFSRAGASIQIFFRAYY